MLRCWAILLFSACLCHPALGGSVSCLWEEFFHIGRNLSGACQIHQPAPLGCQGQSLRLAADGQVLLPYRHTHDTGYFTVPAASGTRLHLRCTLTCPGPEPNGACDITLRGSYPPSPPSQPRCYIPSGGHDLHCDWDPGGDAPLPVNYTLAWQPVVNSSRFRGGIAVTTTNGIVPRREIQRQSKMSVWVNASNALGSEKSRINTFNTGDVVKPPAPVIKPGPVLPYELEIRWKVECPSPVLFSTEDISCQAQYRRQDQDIWTEGEHVAQDSFLLEGAEAVSAYMFRVRCACPGGHQLKSDWSDTYTAWTTEAAPVGVLDVWSDSREMDQAVVWKELPVSKARGIVLGYVVTVDRVGGNRTELNVSAAGLGARQGGGADIGPCCRLPLPLLGVTGVSVSAYNSQGSTSPAPLPLPTTGTLVPGVLSVSMMMGRRGFNISWYPPSSIAETVQEYVVQQEEAGLQFAKGFDWTRTNKTQRSIILTGDFEDYAPYNLSLFGVFGGHSTLLGSVIAYAQQGVPRIVPGFQVSRISSSDVTLTWQHIPLTQRRGVIQCYRLGQGNRTEYTVSKDSTSVQVSGLQPGQVYQFWIVAESEAGEGQKHTVKFHTPTHTGYNIFMLALVPLCTLGLFVICLLCRHRMAVYPIVPVWCYEKVPDLANSKLLLQMQTPVWTGPCPAVEPDPNICLLEIIEAPPQKGSLVGREEEEEQEQEQTDEQEEWEESGSGRKGSAGRSTEESEGYAAVAGEEIQVFSDYEKHFMPCPMEVYGPATNL
ncbi:interleukin-12 receptor subunit beta-2-like isoform X2 [Anguilla anguilla]|nr:interleukin-12 receptor subunit beta-2-like isoform X2 [Anguilla anguilla]